MLRHLLQMSSYNSLSQSLILSLWPYQNNHDFLISHHSKKVKMFRVDLLICSLNKTEWYHWSNEFDFENENTHKNGCRSNAEPVCPQVWLPSGSLRERLEKDNAAIPGALHYTRLTSPQSWLIDLAHGQLRIS